MSLRALASGCLLACSACAAITGLDKYGETECVDPCTGSTGVQNDAGVADSQPIEEETSTNSTPTPPPDAPDAMPPIEAAAQVDSSFRDAADARESGAPEDAPADVQRSEASTTFCAALNPSPLFCEDFDVRPLPGLWTVVHQVGGSLAMDTATFVSAPNALLARNNALPAGQGLDNVLRAVFPLQGAPSTVTLQLELRPAMTDPTPNAVLVVGAIDFVDAANNRYSVQLTLVNTAGALNVLLEEQTGFADGTSAYVAHPIPDPLAVGQWTHVLLTVVLSSSTTGQAHVSFGAAHELDAPLQVRVTATKLQLDVGSSYETEPSMGWNVLYDNVVFDSK
jgi:hypothetical protein